MDRVLEIEREKAAATRKQEVALRPASYKSSLSLAMPVGTTRQKDKRELISEPGERKLHVIQGQANTVTKRQEETTVIDKGKREEE